MQYAEKRRRVRSGPAGDSRSTSDHGNYSSWPPGSGECRPPWAASFRRLLEQAVVTAPLTEAAVTHGYDW